jgi:hypothetical protein
VQPPDSASAHPVDRLIVRLIHDDIEASSADVDRIVERMATAPFNQRPTRVLSRDRGMSYGDIVLGRVDDPLRMHLVKRVVEEAQWAFGTTAEEYLGDLKAAVLHAWVRVMVYERGGDLIAATISPTGDVVSANRRGVNWKPNLLVVYSALHGSVLTGYMFSTIDKLNLPERIRWLR